MSQSEKGVLCASLSRFLGFWSNTRGLFNSGVSQLPLADLRLKCGKMIKDEESKIEEVKKAPPRTPSYQISGEDSLWRDGRPRRRIRLRSRCHRNDR